MTKVPNEHPEYLIMAGLLFGPCRLAAADDPMLCPDVKVLLAYMNWRTDSRSGIPVVMNDVANCEIAAFKRWLAPLILESMGPDELWEKLQQETSR